jgi:hypothetical protein
MYGGKPPGGKKFMTAEEGVDLELFDEKVEIAMTPLLSDEVSCSILLLEWLGWG